MISRYLIKTPGLMALACVLLLALPPFLSSYHIEIVSMLVINLVAVLSFRFIVTMGRWNFAHVQLLGLGGYTSAILVTRFGWSFWLALPLGGLASALASLLISYPCLRTRGFYFFMSTYACGAAIVWSWVHFVNPFGGNSGILGIPRPEAISIPGLLTINFDSRLVYCYLVLFVALSCLVIIYRLEKTKLGNVLKSIALNAPLAKSVGINTMRYETVGYVIGCFFAGIAGVLYVHNFGFSHPHDFGFNYAFYVLICPILGGLQTFGGSVAGTIVIAIITESLRGFREFTTLFYGIILVVLLLFLPGGLESLPKQISSWLKKMIGRGMTREAIGE